MEKISKWILIMNHAIPYKIINVPKPTLNLLKRKISSIDLNWEKAETYATVRSHYAKSSRSSEISWIRDDECCREILNLALKINSYVKWNFNIVGVEPLQFGIYPEGGFYDWHMDEHPENDRRGYRRKISMSLFLNEDFEGGEFDLELHKPEVEPRYETFKAQSGKALFFKSDQWHRVRPVTSGLRKSIVAWFYGPPYS
jgi:PKHD-type hydroxylase|tara:strand:- start:184 stop:780 length:597 start_codon:yes stop_codon:yes gene_type:complete